jgi:hypothetical protein
MAEPTNTPDETLEPESKFLLGTDESSKLEAEDRRRPIPGGEPACPRCGTTMLRHVEKHPAPRAGPSPFRVRLACPGENCGGWTVYDW